ncbi:MAG TPA: zinc-binding dehydrogenase, partial [Acidimicrobiales bacterium]|nr:zinc-binding dehydrogenase [Acidimicrobiales bacterium]
YALAAAGASVTVVDPRSDRLALAFALGALEALEPPVDEPLSAALVRLRSRRPDVVFEVSGTESGLRAALDSVAPGGRVVAVGLQEAPRDVDVRALTLREVELLGTSAHCFARDLPEALRLLASRPVPWGDVAPLAYPLEEVVSAALAPLAEGRSEQVKYLIDPHIDRVRPTRCQAGVTASP